MKQPKYHRRSLQMSFILLLFIFLSTTGIAAESSPSPEARFRLLKMEYTLLPDGSQQYHFRKELVLFTHTAMNNTYGETFVIYNPTYQELKINEAYTRQKDGTLIQAPQNAFVQQLPAAAQKAPAYNHLTEMAIIHTGLELGCTIYLDYTLITKPGYLPELDLCQPILQSSPVDRCEITISVPSVRTLHYHLSDTKKEPSVTMQNGMQHIHWKLSSLPATPREVLPVAERLLTANTWPSPAKAAEYIGTQCTAAQDTTVQNRAHALTYTLHNEHEKVSALLQYVTREIANCPLTLEETGYRIRSAREVMQTAYGTETEKANLLRGLLLSAGLTASLRMTGNLPKASQSTAGLAAIQHSTISTKADTYSYDLNPVTGSLYNNTQNPSSCFTLVYPPSELPITTTPILLESVYTVSITLQNEKEAKMESFLSIPYFMGSLQNTESIVKAKITEKESKNLFPVTADNYVILTLPEPKQQIFRSDYTLLPTQRMNRMQIPHAFRESLHYTITLPQGYTIQTPPQEIQISNSAGSLTMILHPTPSGAEITRIVEIAKTDFAPGKEYSDFHTLTSLWGDPALKRLLLKRDLQPASAKE